MGKAEDMLGLPKSAFPSSSLRLSTSVTPSLPAGEKTEPREWETGNILQPVASPELLDSVISPPLEDLSSQPVDKARPSTPKVEPLTAVGGSSKSSTASLSIASKRTSMTLGKSKKADMSGSKAAEAEAAGWKFERLMLLKRLGELEQQLEVRPSRQLRERLLAGHSDLMINFIYT